MMRIMFGGHDPAVDPTANRPEIDSKGITPPTLKLRGQAPSMTALELRTAGRGVEKIKLGA
jgi:hypothetical protein